MNNETKKICENCKRRPVDVAGTWCMVCGYTSDHDEHAEQYKGEAFDRLNAWMDRTWRYVLRLELSIAKKNSAIDDLICINKLTQNKYCHQLGVECQVCEIKRKVLGE